MKIALFGGTFDPVHTAHLRMAGMLADELSLDRVLFMPTFVPPHKVNVGMAPAEDRLEMCRLAVACDPRFAVSDLEMTRGGASFTVDTLTALREQYPQDDWYLLVGADMFMTFGTWYRFADILQMATVCTIPRDGVSVEQLTAYGETLGGNYRVLSRAVGDVSSTEIRRRLAADADTSELLPPAVAAYIRRKGLYASSTVQSLREMEPRFIEIIRKRESDYRFLHSLEVAKSAEYLAKRYGADEEKARVAGILHDVMKDVSGTEQLQILKDFGILLDAVEQNAPKLWHARSGAAFIEHILKIEDADLINAVRYHTTARAGMSLLEKVVFIADFISADRTYGDVDVMRRLADESLEAAMGYALRYTVCDLQKKGAAVHPDTQAALQEIEQGGN